eukprot:TRINITY_DN21494_c0_g1_i1.p1 TRINITY_DN21494_c0_g1~~TRINITY_DN21494_c0_g1_i1.p1  ORF type:complete len:487 (+),score=157.86 TRINITY_DN21494_c0_g1_i1:61-1521(+)
MAAPVGLMTAQDEDLLSSDEDVGPAAGHRRLSQEALSKKEELEERLLASRQQGQGRQHADTQSLAETEGAESKESLGHQAELPDLWVGPRFVKAMKLAGNSWMKIGRDKESHILLENSSVSKNHCCIRWDVRERIVEFKDVSAAGTKVNGERVKGTKMRIRHGDKIRVEGNNNARYDFILDLRPVRLALSDPRTNAARESDPEDELRKMKSNLKAELLALQTEMTVKDDEISEKEKNFYRLVAKNKELAKLDEHRNQKIKEFEEETTALQEQLVKSREEWIAKLQGLWESNEENQEPIFAQTKKIQDKLAKLEMKKNELERSIFPERYALAELPEMMRLPGPPSTPGDAASVAPSGKEDAEGEEDAFATLAPASGFAPTPAATPGAEVDAPADAGKEPEVQKPISEPAPVMLDPDEIFGQIEADEPAETIPGQPEAVADTAGEGSAADEASVPAAAAEEGADDDDAPLVAPASKRPRLEGEEGQDE